MRTATIGKTMLAIAMMNLVTVTMSSCKKEYHCHCIKTAGGDEETEIKAKSKGDAESECKAKQTGNSSTYKECHIE